MSSKVNKRPSLTKVRANLGAALLFTLLARASAAAPLPQTPPSSGDESEKLTFGSSVEVSWVLVPVVVRGKSGYQTGLKAKHFELWVDGKIVPNPSFETGQGAPVRTLFLQDLSGSMANAGKLEISQRILECFLGRARPADQFSIATFSGGRVEVQIPPTSDVSLLQQAKEAWEPRGTTALHDAVAWLPDLTTEIEHAKRVAVLVTDGVDNASLLAPEKARELVRQAELPVYVLGLHTGSPFVLAPGGEKQYYLSDMLNLLAHFTGASYTSVGSQLQGRLACSSILEDVRHQYVLSFPTRGGPERRFRPIEVRVKGRNRHVAYRKGYLGGPPTSY